MIRNLSQSIPTANAASTGATSPIKQPVTQSGSWSVRAGLPFGLDRSLMNMNALGRSLTAGTKCDSGARFNVRPGVPRSIVGFLTATTNDLSRALAGS